MKKNVKLKFSFWTVSGLFAILFLSHYWQALNDYVFTVVIILFLALIAWLARETWTKGKYKDDLVLAVSAIIITILIFVLQNLQSIEDINNALRSTNKYNCNVAKELKKEVVEAKELNNVAPRIKRRYSTELYKSHMGYLLKKIDFQESKIIFEIIGDMDESNRFLDLSLTNFYELPKNLLNSNEKDNILVSFDAYARVGKIYDKQIIDLSQKVVAGLDRMNSALSASDKCIDAN